MHIVDSPQVILYSGFSPDLQHIRWLIFIIWLLHRLQMPHLYPLGPAHPDATIKSTYTQPAWCAARSARCRVKVKVSSSRVMWWSGGRRGPAGTPGRLVTYSEPQPVNTRLKLQIRLRHTRNTGSGERDDGRILSVMTTARCRYTRYR